MRGITRKVYISILTTIIVTMTMFATTFAWVGMLSESILGGFDLNLKVEKNDLDYSLQISSTGEVGTFGDSVALIDVQKQIMDYQGIDYSTYLIDTNNSKDINRIFTKTASLTPVTTKVLSDNTLDEFYEMKSLVKGSLELTSCKSVYSFDLYLTVEPKQGQNLNTQINSSVLFSNIEHLVTGTLSSGDLVTESPFVDLPDGTPYQVLKQLPHTFTVDSSNATRVALSVYQPIDINSSYSTEKPIKTSIYQQGTQIPSVNENGVYSLGGILDKEYNIALKEINTIYKLNADTTSVDPARLNDLEMIDDNKVIWQSPTNVDSTNINFLGINNGLKTKMKIKVYFWFEGWDADCLNFIDKRSVMLDVRFSTAEKTQNG